MRYKLVLLVVFVLFRMSGCHQHLFTDYRPLDQAGMWSSSVEQLKTLNTSDLEVTQLVRLKQAGIGDDACVTLMTDAQADKEAALREATRNNSGTGFKRVRGRR